jgi:hypothetical protein
MKKDYESLQKEIDKLLWETSQMKTGKTYQEMQRNEKYKSTVKKIGKLMMELEIIEEENRNNRKQNKKIYTCSL